MTTLSKNGIRSLVKLPTLSSTSHDQFPYYRIHVKRRSDSAHNRVMRRAHLPGELGIADQLDCDSIRRCFGGLVFC